MLKNRLVATAGLAPLCCAIVSLCLCATATAQENSQQPSSSQTQQQPSSTDQTTEKQRTLMPVVPTNTHQYVYITGDERAKWFVVATIGPKSLLGSVISAGWGTMLNTPHEYGPHWEGFGQRYGMSIAGNSVSNAMEATLGAVVKEDPRYFGTDHGTFGERAKNIVDLTFRAYHPDGKRHVAFARYAAYVGSNFLSNSWRVNSEADWQHAIYRSGEAFGARAASNAVNEFWPVIWNHLRHKSDNGNP